MARQIFRGQSVLLVTLETARTGAAICGQRSGGCGISSESFGWIPAPGSASPDVSLRPPGERRKQVRVCYTAESKTTYIYAGF